MGANTLAGIALLDATSRAVDPLNLNCPALGKAGIMLMEIME
jgi:hypothetical protein